MNVDSPSSSTSNKIDKRIGLALGSGSARGWSHIGVLRALEEMGVYPGVVAGCSIGALVGAAYANEQLDQLEGWVCSLTWKDIIGIMDLSLMDGGFIGGEKLMGYVSQFLGDAEIQSLPITFATLATELETGREIWLREGNLLNSIRASISVPGLFAPYELDGRWLVDGGLVDPVPVSLCRAIGAEVVIAVNLNGDIIEKHKKPVISPPLQQKKKDNLDTWTKISNQITSSMYDQKKALLSNLMGKNKYVPGLFEVMANSINIMQDRITRSRMAGDPPEVILSPRLSKIGLMEFDKAAIGIKEGRDCVERMRPALEKMLSDL